MPLAQRARTASGPGSSVTLPAEHPVLGSGTVVAQRKISNDHGGFPDSLDDFDSFGRGLANLGDLDGDGIPELAVGAPGDVGRVTDPSAGPSRGAVWVLFFDASGQVRAQRKVEGEGGPISGAFADQFGVSVAAMGDVDGDGIGDMAVGALGDDDGGSDRGAAWVVFLDADGSVKARQKISDTAGGFTGTLQNLDRFGVAVAGLGDLDGDGVRDLAVGSDGNAGTRTGALWVLFLNANGTVKAHQKIDASNGGFTGTLDAGDTFGTALGALGDLDGDGVGDLAVGASGSDGVFLGEGAVWILFLEPDGTVRAHQKISSLEGGFAGGLDFADFFGSGVASIGDFDGDGVGDLAVGSSRDDDGGTPTFDDLGAVYVLLLRPDGTVRGQQKISQTAGGFGGSLDRGESFGAAVAALGDLDGDGADDLAIGTNPRNSGSQSLPGAVWMLSLAADGTVASEYRIRDGEAGFPPSTLDNSSNFGHALAALGDLDGDGVGDIAVGATLPTIGASPAHPTAVWVLLLKAGGGVKSYQKIDADEGGLPAGALSGYFAWGMSVAGIGDLDGDGRVDLAVGALDIGGGGAGSNSGAIFLLFLDADGTVKEHRVVQLPIALQADDEVGRGIASLGDLDGDGVVDLMAGAPRDDDGPPFSDNRGAAYVLFLNADGTLKAFQKISATQGGFTGLPPDRAQFGDAVASLGDVDGDGVGDVAVGAGFEDDGGTDRGAVYVLFLRSDGTVKGHTKISSTQGFPGLVDNGRFGGSVAGLGDLNGDGVRDLAVGGWGSDRVWVLFLNPDGTVEGFERIGNGLGGFTAVLDPIDLFGESVANLGDLDGDGVIDLGVGARGDDDGGMEHGAVWLLNLDGIACIDFSSSDEAVRRPLENGRAVASPSRFARTIQLTSTGANLGPAIFDSTPLGPNDPSQDSDLLVGLGNVLILQNSQAPTQSVPGVFDLPNDDQDGGAITFTFPRGPVEALHLTLVDLDISGQMATVQLFDRSNRTRTYSIPPGWTEDRITHGPPGYRTLDLTTLDPQPGFQATATATQAAGFDPRKVMRLVTSFGSSGALDDLCWDPHPDS